MEDSIAPSEDIKLQDVFDSKGLWATAAFASIGLTVAPPTNSAHAGHISAGAGPILFFHSSHGHRVRVHLMRIEVSLSRQPFFCVSAQEEIRFAEELEPACRNLPWRASKLNERNAGPKEPMLRVFSGLKAMVHLAILIGNSDDATGATLIKRHLPFRPPERQWRAQSWSIKVEQQPSRNYTGLAKRLSFASYAPFSTGHKCLSFHNQHEADAALLSASRYLEEHRQEKNVDKLFDD
ncbi:hypothetical protein CF336_g7751 [Tilletia laevis]|nr:hypothetical protein CF336_g7751 [Tilletia laevis]KAE8187191.1 hypothetical protein CF335_g7244 [Tilletia laevis]